MVEDPIELELTLSRFRRLLADVLRGTTARNSFAPWEAAILLDLENCSVKPRRLEETLRQYEKAVERQLMRGPGPPMTLSEYLAQKT